tara:strand:- start:22300 stop:23262 length:963 start_codon:yes stop_codon:yes gene_type:complete
MLKTYTIPLSNISINSLYDLWINNGFDDESNVDIHKDLLLGSEKNINSIKLYVFENQNFIESSAMIISNISTPNISGVGEVCTSINSRGKGYAKSLCREILEDFFSNNLSEGIFLGTTNPVAKNIYESLGWESVQNSNVMFNSNHKKNFEKFLIDYYDQKSKKQIIEGNANLRLSIIPYVLSLRSKKQIDLNSNINLIDISSGCLSIYNKFDFLRNNQGNWYCQSDQNNKIFSIVSYLDDGQKNFRIDGLFNDSWKNLSLDLLHEIVTKINEKNPKKIFSEVFSEDFYKIDLLQEIGFNFEEDIKKTVENNVLKFKTFSL